MLYKGYKLTQDQSNQLEALNKPNVCYVNCGNVVMENDFDADVFAEHKALLLSFGIELEDIEIEEGDI